MTRQVFIVRRPDGTYLGKPRHTYGTRNRVFPTTFDNARLFLRWADAVGAARDGDTIETCSVGVVSSMEVQR